MSLSKIAILGGGRIPFQPSGTLYKNLSNFDLIKDGIPSKKFIALIKNTIQKTLKSRPKLGKYNTGEPSAKKLLKLPKEKPEKTKKTANRTCTNKRKAGDNPLLSSTKPTTLKVKTAKTKLKTCKTQFEKNRKVKKEFFANCQKLFLGFAMLDCY